MKYKVFRKLILNGKFYVAQKKMFYKFFYKRFFNDVELKSTQKQTIASKQNVHSLTINRTDQTDAGRFFFSSIEFHYSSLSQVFTKQSLIMALVKQLKQPVHLLLAVCIIYSHHHHLFLFS